MFFSAAYVTTQTGARENVEGIFHEATSVRDSAYNGAQDNLTRPPLRNIQALLQSSGSRKNGCLRFFQPNAILAGCLTRADRYCPVELRAHGILLISY